MPADKKVKKSKKNKASSVYEDLLESGELMAPGSLIGTPREFKEPGLNFNVDRAPTPASEWRSARKAAFTVDLPSGQTMLVRRIMNLAKRMRNDTIPNPLAAQVAGMISQGQTEFSAEDLTGDAVMQMMRLFDETLVEMVVQPPVVMPPDDADFSWDPPPGSISTLDISIEDKVFLFQVAQGGTTDLSHFRQLKERFVAASSDEQGMGGAS